MTPLFPARRSAERFDSLVEGGRRDDVDPATSDLLELVGALRSVPEARARPEFVADLRDRLMLAAATELEPVQTARERDDVERLTVKPARTRRERRIGVGLAAVAIIGATTSMAVASQSAIPGDALYPLKRAIENTEAGFSRGDDAKGQAILGDASVRLEEVDKLSHKKDPDAKLVTQTLNTFADQATDAGDHLLSDYEQNGDEQSIEQLHAFNEQSITALSDLSTVIPQSAHDALVNAAQVVMTIDAAAENLCPDCGTGITEVPGQLLADAATALSGLTGTQAGGELTGANPSASSQPGNGGKGSSAVSGLNPPETPIQVPPQPSESSGALGGLLPPVGSGGQSGTSGTGTGSGTSTGTGTGSGNGGKGGKGHHAPVDLTPVTQPVTETVDQVVNGVVQGVNGLLNGLLGGGGTGQ
jgi:hypothetical protein